MKTYIELSKNEMIIINGGDQQTYEWGCKVGIALRQFATIIGIMSIF